MEGSLESTKKSSDPLESELDPEALRVRIAEKKAEIGQLEDEISAAKERTQREAALEPVRELLREKGCRRLDVAEKVLQNGSLKLRDGSFVGLADDGEEISVAEAVERFAEDAPELFAEPPDTKPKTDMERWLSELGSL